jgi:hypothetical protein
MGGGEAGQHLAALLEQDAGAPPVGRRLETRALDRPYVPLSSRLGTVLPKSAATAAVAAQPD